jgi:hypothetical protein
MSRNGYAAFSGGYDHLLPRLLTKAKRLRSSGGVAVLPCSAEFAGLLLMCGVVLRVIDLA